MDKIVERAKEYQDAELTAYERGAKEQKAIELDRWIKVASNVLTEDSLEAFRKAMEAE